MKQDGTTYLVEVGKLKRVSVSKYSESDVPLIGIIRLPGWLTHEVVSLLMNVDDDVVSVEFSEGMKLTEWDT